MHVVIWRHNQDFSEFHITMDILTEQPLRMCKYYWHHIHFCQLNYLSWSCSHRQREKRRVLCHYRDCAYILCYGFHLFKNFVSHVFDYTGCIRRNLPYFTSTLLRLGDTDITKHTSIWSWTVTEIMTWEKCSHHSVLQVIPV